MSDLHHVGRRPVLAGIGAAALAAFFNSSAVRAQAIDRPPADLCEAILYSESATLTDTFTPFGELGAGVLRMLGRIHNVSISEADVTELSKGLASLRPHPDIPDSLRKLKAAGYRMVTLTDSPATPGRGPLQAAGLADLFEQQFTAETVRRYKPAGETYQMVAQATGTHLSELCMIASHPWDLIGARAAGCSTVLIERLGVAPLIVPGLERPQIIAPTLAEIATQLVQLKRA